MRDSDMFLCKFYVIHICVINLGEHLMKENIRFLRGLTVVTMNRTIFRDAVEERDASFFMVKE